MATTNEPEFLVDSSGARRFWPVPVKRIDVAGLTAARDQLWAEAFARVDRGEGWHLPFRLEKAQRMAAEVYEQSDPLAERLGIWVAGVGRSFSVEEAVACGLGIAVEKVDRGLAMKLGGMLHRLGCTKFRPRRAEAGRKYLWEPAQPQTRKFGPAVGHHDNDRHQQRRKGEMSRFNKYDNIFDEHDDGEHIEITSEDEAASDDQGRDEAGAYIATAAKVGGSGKTNADHRRMWVRMAKKALAEGRERRVKAASDEKAARVAAAKAAAREAENEEKAKRSRESIGQFCVEFDARWARIDEETREANAAWEAGREEREAAERAQKAEVRQRPMQVATQRLSEVRPEPGPASPAAANPTRHAATAALPTTIPAAVAAPANRMMSEPRPVRTTPTCQTSRRSPEPNRTPSQNRPATHTSPTAEIARRAAKPLRLEPQRRVAPASTQPAWAPPSASWPPLSASTTAPAGSLLGRPAAAPPPFVVPESPRPGLPVPGRVLTGADLAAWRAGRGLTQRPAADLLGVAPSTVAKAELLPGKVLGDQLQLALAAALRA